MTILLQSNNRAVRSLGNIFGVTSSPDYSALLDFNLGVFRNRVGGVQFERDLSSAIVCERASPGEYVDRFGAARIADANTPRISRDPASGLSGLLIEPARTNYLLNPNAPTSQTVSIPSVGSALYVVLTVEGTGSAMLSGDVSAATPSALQGRTQGAVLVNPGSGVSSVTVTVTGNVSRFQLEVANGGTSSGPHGTSFIVGGGTRALETCRLSDVFFASLGVTEGTVVGHFIDIPRTPNRVASRPGFFAVLNTNSLSGGLHLCRAVAAANTQSNLSAITAGGVSVAKSASAVISGGVRNTAALTFGNSGQIAISAVNGVTASAPAAYSMTPNRLYLGGRGPSNYTNGGWPAFGGILTSLLVYNRQMGVSELAAVSQLWQR